MINKRNIATVDRTPGLPSYLCIRCKQDKAGREFGLRKDCGRNPRVQSYCHACNNERTAPNRDSHKFWAGHLKRTYGITADAYFLLLDQQGGGCAICGAPANRNGTRLCVDHDHRTGAVRGLLCHMCNTVLGKFNDSVELLEWAKHYLIERSSYGPSHY